MKGVDESIQVLGVYLRPILVLYLMFLSQEIDTNLCRSYIKTQIYIF